MNKIIIVLLSVLLFGCTKSTIKTRNDVPLNFDVTGLNDTSMYQTDTVEYNIGVNYLSGNKEKVVLFVSGLPTTMSAGFYPELDTPTYFSTIRFVAHNVDTGTYNITVGASSSTVTKNYTIKIKILPALVNPATVLVGTYDENGSCTVSNLVHDTVSITTINPYFNKVIIKGLWTGSSSINLNADIDPNLHAIIIPSQQSGNQYFSGSGSYTANSISISYVVTDGFLFTDSCNTVLSKQ